MRGSYLHYNLHGGILNFHTFVFMSTSDEITDKCVVNTKFHGANSSARMILKCQ